jgi:hypothetical protein
MGLGWDAKRISPDGITHASDAQINICRKGEETLISGFRRDVDEICGPLGNYTASGGNYLPHNAVKRLDIS